MQFYIHKFAFFIEEDSNYLSFGLTKRRTWINETVQHVKVLATKTWKSEFNPQIP